MFAIRLRSFNGLEEDLRRKGVWERLVGKAKPSADTIGRVLSQVDCNDIRRLLVKSNRHSWRSKAIHKALGEAYRVVAIDGHELFYSTARCCSQCSTREVSDGDKTVVQYYHRVVVAQWADVKPPGILDLEMLRPGEGEVVAAKRMLRRLFANYSRLIDVITADALYLEGEFTRMVLAAGKHFVIVMKQENRILYQDADRLRKMIIPRTLKQGCKTTRLWDIPNLSSFTTLESDVRVVWAEESTARDKRVGGELVEETEEKTWIWVTDLPPNIVPAAKIQKWGHIRWDIENKAFNELCAHWNANHCFIHNANAIEAILLTLSLAFLFTYVFYERNLKPEARKYLTRLKMAKRFLEDISKLDRAVAWASLQQPG
jgi:hypothetical protein